MVLYNSSADSLHVSLVEWQEILNVAAEYGWQPTGTGRPPVALEGHSRYASWNRGYEVPEGQTVGRPDAKKMSQALKSAHCESFRITPSDKVDRLIGFAKTGGFLVCSESAYETEIEVARAKQVISLYARPERFVAQEDRERVLV